jgi:hypothetical protein
VKEKHTIGIKFEVKLNFLVENISRMHSNYLITPSKKERLCLLTALCKKYSGSD